MDNIKKEVSILICGDKEVGKHKIIKNLLNTESEEINKGLYKGTGNLENGKEINCTFIIDTTMKAKEDYVYRNKYKKMNAAIFIFDFSKKKSFQLMKDMVKDFNGKRSGFGVAIIGNKYDEKGSLKVSLEDAKNFAEGYKLDFYPFPIIDEKVDNKEKKQEIEMMKKSIYQKAYKNKIEQIKAFEPEKKKKENVYVVVKYLFSYLGKKLIKK